MIEAFLSFTCKQRVNTMSQKRKLIPCASSDNFQYFEISSGSETESATEESVSAKFEGEISMKKMRVDQSESNVEVLLVEDGPVDRKVEIVRADENQNENEISSFKIDEESSDQEITFLKVAKSVPSKPHVKSLAELAASACRYPVDMQGKSIFANSLFNFRNTYFHAIRV